MDRFPNIENLYRYAEGSIQHIAIQDQLFEVFSTEVRRLRYEMRDWIEVSSDWDEVIANLRRAEWRLRNQPAEFGPYHRGKLYLAEALSKLDGLYSNLGDDIRRICITIEENGKAILLSEESSLNLSLKNIIRESIESGAQKIQVVLHQEDLINPCKDYLAVDSSKYIEISTGNMALTNRLSADKIIVVGNSRDYSSSVFTSLFCKYGTTLLGYSWIPEQNFIYTNLGSIATKKIEIKVDHVFTSSDTKSIEISDFLEPSSELASGQLSKKAQKIFEQIENQNIEEDTVRCKAYLLAGDYVVFLPVNESSIDSIDLQANAGSRVHRIPIGSIEPGTVILLRVGKSDSDAIFEMANNIGAEEAKSYRELQRLWKENLKLRIQQVGIQEVVKQLKNRGIKNPWIAEWRSIKNNIAPEREDYFRILLDYLGIQPEKTILAMKGLRRYHLVAAMRLRKMLKDKFEHADLNSIHEEGYLIEDLDESHEIAKLGAFVCLSIGSEVFEVPESAVKQLQRMSI